jgi:hypothetical protein
MNMGETAAGNFNHFWLQMHVFVDFAALAVEACPSQGCDLLAEVRPTEPGGDQTTRCTDPRMGNVVESMEGGGAELWRHKRPEFTCGDISQQLMLPNSFGDDGKSRGGSH